ncbi:MAG: NYN domain-containing protein [Hydrogenophaga sp.]|nr:NYN domain-containing protein [Hydrogenophaga sp.]
MPTPRLAVLIDAENAHAAQAPQVMAQVRAYGRPTVCRAYGDWTTTQLAPWKKLLQTLSIRPYQQFRHVRSKNATDSVLIVDAMDLLYARKVDGMCIVSSDSDYTALARRIQEEGLRVYGFGQRYTPAPFVAACDAFTFLDDPSPPAEACGPGPGSDGVLTGHCSGVHT